ncbi:MAG: hypothetical protein IKT93_04315 [Clostridia bacterium]|nr:hypothetical protein [Clostridia bacterium]
MSSGSKAVKNTAMITFKNNMISCIFGGLILIFTYYSCNLISSLFYYFKISLLGEIVFFLLLFFIFLPMLLGLLRFYWRMILGVTDKPISVFYNFSDLQKYKKAIKLQTVFLIKAFVRGIALFLPAILVKLISQEYFYDFFGLPMPLWAGNLLPVFNGLVTFSLVILLFLMLKFYLSPMLYVADENIDVDEAIHMSNIISKKSGIDFIYLCASFIGWIILSLLVFPLIFTLPYMLLSYLYHSRFAIAEYNKHIENQKIDSRFNFSEGI